MINVRGNLIALERPLIMGIVNATPDSFYSRSRINGDSAVSRVETMLNSGADIIDIGACSTRPGSTPVSAEEENKRLIPVVRKIRDAFPEAIISVDTFRASVAEAVFDCGADIINDITGGDADKSMFETIAKIGVPYVLTCNRVMSRNHNRTFRDDITAEVLKTLAFKADILHQAGVCDVIIDPGFGFTENREDNFKLLATLKSFKTLGCPVLAGLSRKRMVWEELGISPDRALNGTTALNMIALINGADILRVHDVGEAKECVMLFEAYKHNIPEKNIIISRDLQGSGKSEISCY